MAFVTFTGLTLYTEKNYFSELSCKIANITYASGWRSEMIVDKILTVFSNLFERMERIGIKSPVKNNFWLFKDFKSFEGFLEAHFASYALVKDLWCQNICDVSVIHLLALWSVFGQNARAPSRSRTSQSFLFVIQSDKRLPEIRPGSNRKYGISEVYSREKLRGVAGSRVLSPGPKQYSGS